MRPSSLDNGSSTPGPTSLARDSEHKPGFNLKSAIKDFTRTILSRFSPLHSLPRDMKYACGDFLSFVKNIIEDQYAGNSLSLCLVGNERKISTNFPIFWNPAWS